MKLNIHKKVLMLVLGAGLTTFIVLGIFSYFAKNVVERDMAEMSIELGENSAAYTDNLLIEQLKQTHYSPKTLPDPRNVPIKNAEPYRIYAPDIRDNLTPEIQNELELAANVSDVLTELLKSYTGYNATNFVAGEKGWHIGNRLLVDAEGNTDFDTPIYFSYERIYEFDPRKRSWYIAAKNANAPVFSELYRTVEAGSALQTGASAPFYDAAGNFIGVAGLDSSNADLYNAINELTAGKGSVNFVLNGRGEIIFSSQESGALAVNVDNDLTTRSGGRDLRNSSEQTLATAAAQMVNGNQGVLPVTLNGKNFYLAFAPVPSAGWSFGMIIPEEEILNATQGNRDYFQEQVANLQAQMRREHSYLNDVAGAIPVALLIILFLMSTGLSRRFVKPIHELADGVREISSGNLDKKLNIKTGDEIEHLATCFNAMTDELQTYMKNLTRVTAEKERIATELDVATEIQRGMLPKDLPAREDFELFATMTPAKEVGGDFYDFYFLDEKHLAITVADVSGKGIPAALFMVISKTILNNFAASFYKQNGLADVVAAANDKLCTNNEAMMFVTAFIGVLDLETGEFIFVNAGHNPPVIHHDNHCEFLDVKKNFVLGAMDGIPFVEQKILLKRGDLLFIYTDGVTEALNVSEEEYLPERLIKFMNATDCAAPLEILLKRVRADVVEHVGAAE